MNYIFSAKLEDSSQTFKKNPQPPQTVNQILKTGKSGWLPPALDCANYCQCNDMQWFQQSYCHIACE